MNTLNFRFTDHFDAAVVITCDTFTVNVQVSKYALYKTRFVIDMEVLRIESMNINEMYLIICVLAELHLHTSSLESIVDMIRTQWCKQTNIICPVTELNLELMLGLYLRAYHCNFRRLMKLCLKSISNIPLNLTDADKIIEILDPRDQWKNNVRFLTTDDIHPKRYARLMSSCASYIANALYRNIRQLYLYIKSNNQDHASFIKCHRRVVYEWLKMPLIVDSENSVITIFYLWLINDDRINNIFILDYIKNIQYCEIKPYYLMNIFPVFYLYINKYMTDTNGGEMAVAYMSAMRKKVLFINKNANPDKLLELSTFPRTIIPDAKKMCMRCVLQNVNTWDAMGKYYSTPILVNGYEFYYFVQRHLVDNNVQPPVYGMSGFLRCSGSIIPQCHYLPVAYNVIIQTPRNTVPERKFSTMRIIYTHPERAIGGKITVDGETWDDIILGNSVIVNQNTITILVEIEFLSNDEGCLTMQEINPR